MWLVALCPVASPVRGALVVERVWAALVQGNDVVDDERSGVEVWEVVVDRLPANPAWRLTAADDRAMPIADRCVANHGIHPADARIIAAMRITIAVASMLAVAGCGAAPVSSTPPTSTLSAASAAPSSAATSQSSTSSASAHPLTKPFGSTFTWDDGLAVTISTPKPFTPKSDLTYQDKVSKTFVMMDVTLRNGSPEPKSPGQLFLAGTTGNRESQRVFDTASGADLEPWAKVLPGREVTWKVAFGVDAGRPFTLQVDFGFDRKGGVYEANL